MSFLCGATFGVRKSLHLKSLQRIRCELNSLPNVQNNLPALTDIVRGRFNFWSKSGYSSYVAPANAYCAFNERRNHAYKQTIAQQDNLLCITSRYFSTKSNKKVNFVQPNWKDQRQIDEKKDEPDHADSISAEATPKLGIVARFRLMFKQYWYVLVPVHCVTSVAWFGTFYYLSSSGVDIPSLLQTLHIPSLLQTLHMSDTIITGVKDSSMGHLAIAFLCYKIAAPARYAITLGGSTIAIKYLSQWGYIKPMPSKERLKQIYDEKKAQFKGSKE